MSELLDLNGQDGITPASRTRKVKPLSARIRPPSPAVGSSLHAAQLTLRDRLAEILGKLSIAEGPRAVCSPAGWWAWPGNSPGALFPWLLAVGWT